MLHLTKVQHICIKKNSIRIKLKRIRCTITVASHIDFVRYVAKQTMRKNIGKSFGLFIFC